MVTSVSIVTSLRLSPATRLLPEAGDAGLFGGELGSPGHEELAHFVPVVQPSTLGQACSEGDPAGTPFIRDSHDEQERCSMESFL
ncbi:MAG TPA: hypothetical protein VGN49_00535 [Micrococcaceae bacterium]|jgi:hypothetical protein|nr:hypothetical protein [Micrococcaceae bacterium]